MRLLDQLAKQGLGDGDGQGPQAAQLTGLAEAVMGMLGEQRQNGLEGLRQGFQRAGLDGVIGSWISMGQNQAISGAQLEEALGSDRVADLARQAGLSAEQGRGALAQLLPTLVDELTPDGRMPDSSQFSQLGGNLLRSLLR